MMTTRRPTKLALFSPALTSARRAARWAAIGAALGTAGAGCTAVPHNDAQESPSLSLPTTPDGRTLGQMGFDTAELDKNGTPLYLAGHLGADPVRDGTEARRLVRDTLGRAYRLAQGSDFQVINQTNLEGRRFYRMQQTHRGLPVLGAEVVVQAEAGGAVEAVLGQAAPDLRDPAAPALSSQVAVQRALSSLALPGTQPVVHSDLGQVLVNGPQGAQLAFGAVVEYVGQNGRAIDRIYASGKDGSVLARRPRIYEAINRTMYDIKNVCLKDGSELPGTLVLNEGGAPSSDTSVMNAYGHIGTTYWYYKNFFNRDSFDGMGVGIKAGVHAKFDTGMGGCTAANAAWIGETFQQMVYGDGDFLQIKNTTLALDVTAHELTHAVTNLTSDLAYENESGALNEGMSDILGAGAEAWSKSGGSAAGNPATITATANTWKIGEEVVGLLLGSLGALRLMDNPTKDGYSKDYYPERITGTADNGGVHGNSGIANLAFYLLSQGGKHPRSKTAVTVSSIGIEKALRIYYLANTALFTSTTDFKAARYATAQAARTLFGRCSGEWSSTHQSWDAVGVLGAWTLCARPPVGF